MTLGNITAKLVANTKEFDAKMVGAGKTVDGMSTGAVKSTSKIGTALGAIGSVATVTAVAVGGAFALITKTGIQTAAQLESARQGFKALLGSAEEADAVMDRIKKEAALTPFELTGLTAGVQALTAITKDGDKAVDILLDVGKAVAISGKGSAELDRVILNLQQISATGRVTEMDIRQFQGAIPIFNDIIGAVGLTTDELKEADNSAELLFEAFRVAGAEGGIAVEGFASQAGTWNQLISNLKDNWQIFTSDFVERTGIFDSAKEILTIGMEKVFNFLNDKLIPAVIDMKEWIQEAWVTVKEYWDLYGQPVFDMIVEFINNTLIPAWNYLKEQIVKAMEESGVEMEDVKKVVLILAAVIGGTLVGAVLVIVGAISGLIFIIGTLITFFSKLQQAIYAKFDEIKSNIQWHIDRIKDIFNAGSFKDGLLSAMKYPFEAFWRWISGLFDKIKNKIQDALDLTKRHSPSVIDKLKMGINLAEKEFNKLGDMRVTPVAELMVGGASGSTMGGINLSINMSGANISSPEVAQDYAEQIGDAIVGKLRTSRRSYV